MFVLCFFVFAWRLWSHDSIQHQPQIIPSCTFPVLLFLPLAFGLGVAASDQHLRTDEMTGSPGDRGLWSRALAPHFHPFLSHSTFSRWSGVCGGRTWKRRVRCAPRPQLQREDVASEGGRGDGSLCSLSSFSGWRDPARDATKGSILIRRIYTACPPKKGQCCCNSRIE